MGSRPRRPHQPFDSSRLAVSGGRALTSFTDMAAIAAPVDQIVDLPLASLWLEHQPREIVPDERLQALIAADQAQPMALLAELRALAEADRYAADILEELDGLARSVAAQGVLQPIEVVQKAGRAIIRDGHRRSLAALLADKTTIPARLVSEASEIDAVARAVVVNLQRKDLGPIEKATSLLRLTVLIARQEAEGGADLSEAEVVRALTGARATEEAADLGDNARTLTGVSRAVAARVRERVCALIGIKERTYYNLLALNRLAPDARAAGRRLSERHLQPICALPAEEQAEVTTFAVRRGLTSDEVASLVKVVRTGDRDKVARLMDRLAHEEQRPSRTAVSWEGLLNAVPDDVEQRLNALEAELVALTPERRQARLRRMRDQLPRLDLVQARFAAMLARFTPAAPPSDEESEPPLGESPRPRRRA